MDKELFTKVIASFIGVGVFILYWWLTGVTADGLWFFAILGLVFVSFVIVLSVVTSYLEKNFDQFLGMLRAIGILPRPTESGLFVMAITTLLVFTIYNLWPTIYSMIVWVDDPRTFIVSGFLLFGIGLSIYHMFTDREKTEREVEIMKFFMVVVLIGVSISTALFVHSEKQPGYLILSVWSAVQAIVLYLLANRRWVNKTIVIDSGQATRKELYVALVVVPLVIIVAKLLDQHWVIAFSSTLFIWSYAEIFLTSRGRKQTTLSN